MKDFVELIKAVDDLGLCQNQISTENPSSSDLLKNILFGQIKTKNDALSTISNLNNSYSKLNTAKTHLERGIRHYLLSDTVEKKIKNESVRKAIIANKHFLTSIILDTQGYPKVALTELEQALSIAVEFELFALCVAILSRITKSYSLLYMSKSNFYKYSNQLKEYQELLQDSIEANYYYEELSLLLNEGGNKNLFTKKINEYSQKLRLGQKNNKSYTYNRLAYTIHSTKYILEKKFKQAITNADEALEFLEEMKFPYDIHLRNFYSDKAIANMLLGNYQIADIILNDAIARMRKKTQNYIRFHYYKYLNFSHWKNYEELYSVVNIVFSNSFVKKLTSEYQKWKIREAYVRFLVEAGKVDFDKIGTEPPNKFRLARFLNEVPIYTRDKRGFNISILVIQMLFFIVRRNYDKVIDRIDALNQYSYKYLRNDETYRSNCFIKMLVKIPGANFHPVRTKLHTSDLEAKLRAREMTVEELLGEVEVIPFHDLWDIILEVLEKNWNNK